MSASFRWTQVAQPVVGMLHAPPLPGSPKYGGDMAAIRSAVLQDAAALAEGGVHALLLENFGDAPFYPRRVPVHTVAELTALAAEVRRQCPLPLGINVLRNDGRAALAIAHAVGAAFIRVNVLCGARVTDQGLIQGVAHRLLRERAALGAGHIEIWADVDVKHSAPLAVRPLAEEVEEMISRGGADAVIVSGSTTGRPVGLEALQTARKAAGQTPVIAGSGVSIDGLEELAPWADALIVGTAFKRDGVVTNPVDPARVAQFMRCHTAITAGNEPQT